MELNIFSILMVDLRSKLNTSLIWVNNEYLVELMRLLGLFYCFTVICIRVVFLGLICLLVCMQCISQIWSFEVFFNKTHFNSSVSVNYQLFLSWVMIKVPVTILMEQEIVRTMGTILFYNAWIYTRFVCFFFFMVFNASFNNISAISWRSVLLMEETGWRGENNRPVGSFWQILSHNVVYLALIEFRTRNISGDRYWLYR